MPQVVPPAVLPERYRAQKSVQHWAWLAGLSGLLSAVLLEHYSEDCLVEWLAE